MSALNLTGQRCTPKAPALERAALEAALAQLPGWNFDGGMLRASFAFRDYHETMAFVNALAWISHTEDHHPDLQVSYKECAVAYTTHSAGSAVTANDLICAAHASAIYAQRAGA